ncbi:MAG: prepilin-type N-terminal cleavage/methylation domain-containing protein [Candidatus Liptonbacteria bacterium]|nr:prepilin-type N-terminal cleavage/methylation domain-containing protein [Candidatus Liptonbacteria bacterium]
MDKVIHNKKSKNGFSLVEVIIFAAISAVLVLVVSSLTSNVSNIENFVNQKLQSRSTLDQTFQVMVTDIRSAGPASNGAYPIQSASTSSLVFFSDIDQDGIFERVRYTLVTSTVEKGVIKPTGTFQYVTSSEVVKNVIYNAVNATGTNFFDYFDDSYTGTQTAMTSTVDVSKIRVVKVSVHVDTNPGKAPNPLLFSDTITIRNLRSN